MLKELKQTHSDNIFEEKMMEVRRLVSNRLKYFLISGVSNIFKDINSSYPIALASLVNGLSPYIERVYQLRVENKINKNTNGFIIENESNGFKITENLNSINEVIRAFVNGSKSYYIITNQEKLLKDLVSESLDELELIILNKISEVFDVKDKEFIEIFELISHTKGR